MIGSLRRKAGQVVDDPALRSWLIGRLFGRNRGAAPFVPHHPPYLKGLALGECDHPSANFAELATATPTGPMDMPLAGKTLHLEPGDMDGLFRRTFDDVEDMLSLHRFAWLALLGGNADPAWVQSIWTAWRRNHANPDDSWSWHPYTAAERVVNVLAYARRHGLPGPIEDTMGVLAAHGPAIARRLEYFGDHHTSNHLSNNGRGLYLLGLALSDESCAAMGARILLEEAKRIFAPSGILREGSSHYHLLLTRNYVEAWLAARSHQRPSHSRPEEPALREIATRALAAAVPLCLPGGMPLIGDISPDCPPPFLAGLGSIEDADSGWTGLLDGDDRQALGELMNSVNPGNTSAVAADGWLRADFGRWSGLWHASPQGWSHMPGHGHQDCGGFEIHCDTQPIFCDLGRGAYGEEGEAALYRAGKTHNVVLIDGQDPYPPNRPYYGDAFRQRLCGPPPTLNCENNGVMLRHHGFSRLRGVGGLERRWLFSETGFTISERIEGRGHHKVSRYLHTTLPVKTTPGGAVIGDKFRLSAEEPITTEPVTRWQAYGRGRPATAILVESEVSLPWESKITIEAL